jgi:hypothetical protein
MRASAVIPFHFKVDTNRQQRSRGAGEKELETNHLYQGFREMV